MARNTSAKVNEGSASDSNKHDRPQPCGALAELALGTNKNPK